MVDRNTWVKDGILIPVPVDANTTIHAGNVVCIKASGYAGEGGNATTTVIGVAQDTVENIGAAGDIEVLVMRKKAFCLANDSATPVTGALIGKECHLLDSITVTATATGHPVAGTVLEVGPDGVWVEI